MLNAVMFGLLASYIGSLFGFQAYGQRHPDRAALCGHLQLISVAVFSVTWITVSRIYFPHE